MGTERGTGIWGETVIWGGEGDVRGGGEGDLGEVGIWVVETVMWRVVERGSGGGDVFLFRQARTVLGESGRGIGIAGEPGCCGEGDVGVMMFAYFAKQGEFWERVEGELVLQGNLHVVVCPCFSLDL